MLNEWIKFLFFPLHFFAGIVFCLLCMICLVCMILCMSWYVCCFWYVCCVSWWICCLELVSLVLVCLLCLKHPNIKCVCCVCCKHIFSTDSRQCNLHQCLLHWWTDFNITSWIHPPCTAEVLEPKSPCLQFSTWWTRNVRRNSI